MKKLSILLLLPFFIACSSGDNELDNIKPELPKEEVQDHTSVVFVYDRDIEINFTECVAGYYTADKIWLKLGDLGTISPTQISKEIKIDIDTLQHIYIFMNAELKGADFSIHQRTKEPFVIKKNYKNVFNFANKEYESIVGDAPWNYPL